MFRNKIFIVILIFFSLTTYSNSPAVDFYNSGLDAFNNYDYFLAYEKYHNAIELNPNYFEPILGLAELLFLMGEYEQSLVYISRGLSLDKKNIKLLNIKGRTLMGLNQFEDAEKIFNQILNIDRTNFDARLGLSDLAVVTGAFDKATRGYKDIINITGKNKRALMSLILVYDSLNYSNSAEKYILKLLEQFPNDIDVRLLAAKHYKNRGDTRKALENGTIAFNIQPKYFDTTIFLSNLYLDIGEYSKAIDLLMPFTETRANKYIVWYLLGKAYELNNEIDKALNFYHKTLKIRAGDEISRIAIENLILENRLYDEKITKELSQTHFKKAKQYLDKNYLKKALSEYRQGLKLNPFSKKGREGLAEYYKRSKYNAVYYDKISELYKQNPDNIEYADNTEIYKSFLKNSVAFRWGIDQFDELQVSKNYFNIAVFFKEKKDNLHYGIEEELLKYCKYQMAGNYRMNINFESSVVESFSKAFEVSKQNGSDYFLVIEVEEAQRSISLVANLFFSSSGVKAGTYKIVRTGNDMIANTINTLIDKITADFPLFGSIVRIEFDKAVVNIGKIDGVKVGDKLYIVRNGTLGFGKSKFAKKYKENDVIAYLTIDKVDDIISEGTIERRYFYDLVNEQDKVILQPKDAPPLKKEKSVPWEIYQEILKIK